MLAKNYREFNWQSQYYKNFLSLTETSGIISNFSPSRNGGRGERKDPLGFYLFSRGS